VAKNGSFGFLSVGSCVGKNQMCHLRVGCLFTLTHNEQVLPMVGQLKNLRLATEAKLKNF